ncbi:hypothetical protein C8A05DRAFT_37766 [Staphylotrichum tortipilum]|uniref:Uncharacterized protein n=1 Tax=Staphylotrichum tortipilum TaxID=2831512 RepID=A0AAN6RPW6_9PEZI|nr:hypothetical protein C8A05DRAFT_37766 [Staphylotrichum longicolle]
MSGFEVLGVIGDVAALVSAFADARLLYDKWKERRRHKRLLRRRPHQELGDALTRCSELVAGEAGCWYVCGREDEVDVLSRRASTPNTIPATLRHSHIPNLGYQPSNHPTHLPRPIAPLPRPHQHLATARRTTSSALSGTRTTASRAGHSVARTTSAAATALSHAGHATSSAVGTAATRAGHGASSALRGLRHLRIRLPRRRRRVRRVRRFRPATPSAPSRLPCRPARLCTPTATGTGATARPTERCSSTWAVCRASVPSARRSCIRKSFGIRSIM